MAIKKICLPLGDIPLTCAANILVSILLRGAGVRKLAASENQILFFYISIFKGTREITLKIDQPVVLMVYHWFYVCLQTCSCRLRQSPCLTIAGRCFPIENNQNFRRFTSSCAANWRLFNAKLNRRTSLYYLTKMRCLHR